MLAEKLLTLFQGSDIAHGVTDFSTLSSKGNESGKFSVKSRDVEGPPTRELWMDHLKGNMGLGCHCMNTSHMVKWAVIDVDVYQEDTYLDINQKLIDNSIPAVVVRSKSGGAHCYFFFDDWIEGKHARNLCITVSSHLGLNEKCDFFPSSSKLHYIEKKQRYNYGQFINMPYFNMGKDFSYAIDREGRRLTADEFIEYAHGLLLNVDAVREWKPETKEAKEKLTEMGLPEGSMPCILSILTHYRNKIPEGVRNNMIFNIGILYAKHYGKSSSTWEEKVKWFNYTYIAPPLSSQDVENTIRSIKNNDYTYKCNERPLVQFCNKTLCRHCIYGPLKQLGDAVPVGLESSLVKYTTDPPEWFLETSEGVTLKLTTADLQSPQKYQLAAMEQANLMPAKLKANEWEDIIRPLIAKCRIIEVDENVSKSGLFIELLEEFLNQNAIKAHPDKEGQYQAYLSKGNFYFKSNALREFLVKRRFTDLKPSEQATIIMKRLKGEYKRLNVGRFWVVPLKNVDFNDPDQIRETITAKEVENEQEPY